MTYSVFGCVVVDEPRHVEGVAHDIARLQPSGLVHHLGAQGLIAAGDELRMLRELRLLDERGTTLPFFLTRDAGDDNSTALLYGDGFHATLHRSGLPGWASTIGALDHVTGIELLVTEGYDVAFLRIACSYDDIGRVLDDCIERPTETYPSLHLSIRPLGAS